MAAVVNKCGKDLSRFGVACTYPTEGGSTCVFHLSRNAGLSSGELEARLTKLIERGEGNWVGFTFPDDVRLSGLVAECKIDARGMDAKSVIFKNCQFREGIDLRHSVFEDSLIFEAGEIHGEAYLAKITVEKEFRWAATAHGLAHFENSIFKGPAKIVGEFNGNANFTGAVFHDSAEFVGGVIRFMSTTEAPNPPERARLVFNAEAYLSLIDFRRPSRCRFRNVDLRRSQVCDTDFRGVSFYAVEWDQPTLDRRGIFDEVEAIRIGEVKRLLPRLEAAYRNLRAAHEDSKDYQSATDFYVGELECRRRQLPRWRQILGIEGMYRLLSMYGSKPWRAFRGVLVILGLHMLATTAIQDWHCFSPATGCTLDVGIVVNSARLLTILGGPKFEPLPGLWTLVDTATQVLLAIQIALLIFALRARIRRG